MQKFYNKGKYFEAVPIIEDLMQYYKGTDTAELLYFMLADCYYLNKEYMISAYHYKTFRDLYPRSYKTEVASFRIADCYRREIPRLELEQTDTEKAIQYYQQFIADHPKSPMVEVAYEHIRELKRIMETKALDAANLYYKTGNYRAAAVTYKNVIAQYPNITEYEMLMYRVGMSYYKFAEKSILGKQTDRYETALNEGNAFLARYPKSQYASEITAMTTDCKQKILETAIKHASTYLIVAERPLYFNQAMELHDEYIAEIKANASPELKSYKDRCYLGILRSYTYIIEETKDEETRKLNVKSFYESYYQYISKFRAGSAELYEAESLFKKINQYYKS